MLQAICMQILGMRQETPAEFGKTLPVSGNRACISFLLQFVVSSRSVSRPVPIRLPVIGGSFRLTRSAPCNFDHSRRYEHSI